MKMSYASYHDLVASFIAESCEPEVISLRFTIATGRDMCETYLKILDYALGLKYTDGVRSEMKKPKLLEKLNRLVNYAVDSVLHQKPELRYKEVEI